MTKEEVGARIEEFGIIPAIRLSSTADARFAAEAVYRAGLPIAEITMTVPGALALISVLLRDFPDMVVGAGTVLDADTARHAVDAGARFITSTGMDASRRLTHREYVPVPMYLKLLDPSMCCFPVRQIERPAHRSTVQHALYPDRARAALVAPRTVLAVCAISTATRRHT